MSDMDTDTGNGAEPLLAIRDLTVRYPAGRDRLGRMRHTTVLDRIGLRVEVGETVGLVGESGSGKTTLGRAVLGLAPVASGSIRYAGRELVGLPTRDRRRATRGLQTVFQDPHGSINPAVRAGAVLAESAPPAMEREAIAVRSAELLEAVGLRAKDAVRYPGTFSGGQRQRLAIARALMSSPQLVVCDEPVSALDLSVQAQILNLLTTMQEKFQLAYLFIGHNLEVVRHVSERIVVLYRGRVVEHGPAEAVSRHAQHPYTRALAAAAPVPDPELQARRREAAAATAVGTGAGAAPRHAGCPFEPRCPSAIAVCREQAPPLRPTRSGSLAACHLIEPVEADVNPPDRSPA